MKNLLLFPIWLLTIMTSRSQQSKSINDEIKDRFYKMLQTENVLLDDNEIKTLRQQWETNSKNEDYVKLDKKKREDKKLKEKDLKLYNSLREPFEKLDADEKKKSKLTANFPKPVEDTFKYDPNSDYVGGVKLDALSSLLLTTQSISGIINGSAGSLDSWVYGGSIFVQDPYNFNKFSYSYSSRKFLLTQLETDVKVGLPFLQSSLDNNFSFNNSNAIDYTVIGGHFLNNLKPIFVDCRSGSIKDFNSALPLLLLWRKYSQDVSFKGGFVIDEFNAVFIKKSLSANREIDSQNSLAVSGGYGFGVFDFKGSSKVDFSNKVSSQYDMSGFDIIFYGPKKFVDLPTPEQIQKAWTMWSKKQSQLNQILNYNKGDSVNLIFGPIIESEANAICLDTSYTGKNLISQRYRSLTQLLSIGIPKPIPNKPGFFNVPLIIKNSEDISSQINTDLIEDFTLPVRLTMLNKVGTLELAREYSSEITLHLKSDFFPVFTEGQPLEANSVSAGAAVFSETFKCDDADDNRPTRIKITAVSSEPKNQALTDEINIRNMSILKSSNNDFVLRVNLDTTKINTVTKVTCRFVMTLKNGTNKTITTDLFFVPYKKINLIAIKDPSIAPEDVLSKVDPKLILNGKTIESMSQEEAVLELKKNGLIQKNAFSSFLKKEKD